MGNNTIQGPADSAKTSALILNKMGIHWSVDLIGRLPRSDTTGRPGKFHRRKVDFRLF